MKTEVLYGLVRGRTSVGGKPMPTTDIYQEEITHDGQTFTVATQLIEPAAIPGFWYAKFTVSYIEQKVWPFLVGGGLVVAALYSPPSSALSTWFSPTATIQEIKNQVFLVVGVTLGGAFLVGYYLYSQGK